MASKRGRRAKDEPGNERGVRIRLFDADRTDKTLSFNDAMRAKTTARQLLWIDVEGDLADDSREQLVRRFELDERTNRVLEKPTEGAKVRIHDRHFVITVAANIDPSDPSDVGWLDIVAGSNVVITRHDESVAVLKSINQRIAEDATIGILDSSEFVAALTEAILIGYHEAVDRVEDELDEFDAEALQRGQPRDMFGRLVEIRRRIGRLRRLLASHRELFGALGSPDFARGIDSADPEVFQHLVSRFDGVLTSLESTREVVLGSFDVLMTRTAQRTNDVIRVLTVATVLALPATIAAGFMGMNVILPLPDDDPGSFWVMAGVVVLIEVSLLAIARWREWI